MKKIAKPEFVNRAKEIAAELNEKVEDNFERFLKFIYDYPMIVNEKGGVALCDETTPEQAAKFLQTYIGENFDARKKKIRLDDVKTVPDPAVSVVLEVFGRHDPARLRQMEKDHRHSMAAENKIGQLLEAYIAQNLEPKGWFWCSCEILKGVDFFKPDDEIVLLQVKNRDNSENSSSSAIRQALEAVMAL